MLLDNRLARFISHSQGKKEASNNSVNVVSAIFAIAFELHSHLTV